MKEKVARIWTADYRQHHGLRAVRFPSSGSRSRPTTTRTLPPSGEAHSAPISSGISRNWPRSRGAKAISVQAPGGSPVPIFVALRCTQAARMDEDGAGLVEQHACRNITSRQRQPSLADRERGQLAESSPLRSISRKHRGSSSAPPAVGAAPRNWLSRDDLGRKTRNSHVAT
jgi:hypothetical protein